MMGDRSAPCQRLFFRLILACIATCPTYTRSTGFAAPIQS